MVKEIRRRPDVLQKVQRVIYAQQELYVPVMVCFYRYTLFSHFFAVFPLLVHEVCFQRSVDHPGARAVG